MAKRCKKSEYYIPHRAMRVHTKCPTIAYYCVISVWFISWKIDTKIVLCHTWSERKSGMRSGILDWLRMKMKIRMMKTGEARKTMHHFHRRQQYLYPVMCQCHYRNQRIQQVAIGQENQVCLTDWIWPVSSYELAKNVYSFQVLKIYFKAHQKRTFRNYPMKLLTIIQQSKGKATKHQRQHKVLSKSHPTKLIQTIPYSGNKSSHQFHMQYQH